MDDSVELQSLENNNETVDKEQVASGNGDYRPNTAATEPETSSLLHSARDGAPVADSSIHIGDSAPPQESNVQRVKRELVELLDREVCGLKLWKVFIIVLSLLLVIVLLVFIGFGISIAAYKDPDETYDVNSFVVPRIFNGSLSVNQTFSRNTTALHDLATELQNKMNAVYRSSHVLARYFRHARITTLRNGSVIAEFCLAFRMPLDSDLLQHYPLSQEVVSSVLRQHLYDQDASGGGGDPLRILPTSVRLQDGASGCNS